MDDEIGEPLPAEVVDAINQRSAKLLDEYAKHFQDVSHDLQALNPDIVAKDGWIDEPRIFRGWAIQKLASMQLLIEDLYDRVETLEDEADARDEFEDDDS